MSYNELEEVILTQRLVQIQSSNPGTYEKAVADFVFEWLSKNTNAEVIREKVEEERDNIIARIRGEKNSPNLVYICHMDTVPIGEGWNFDALNADIIDGKMYGRGACDMKSGLAAGMIAFRNIAALKTDLLYDFLFIATVNEEDTMTGAEQVVKDGYVDSNSYVLDAEPTNHLIQVAHKGKTWFRLKTHGLAAHASTPHKGHDAIAAMAEVICAINRRIAKLPKHEEMGASSATFGTISGGTNVNIVPDGCTATIDMRIVPPTTNAESIQLVNSAIAEAVARVPGTSCEYTVFAQRPSIDKDDNSFLLNKLKKATAIVNGKEARVDFFPGYTDSAVIAALTCNHNCMSYGPGDLSVAHKPDEYVECADIKRCVKVLTALAKDILTIDKRHDCE